MTAFVKEAVVPVPPMSGVSSDLSPDATMAMIASSSLQASSMCQLHVTAPRTRTAPPEEACVADTVSGNLMAWQCVLDTQWCFGVEVYCMLEPSVVCYLEKSTLLFAMKTCDWGQLGATACTLHWHSEHLPGVIRDEPVVASTSIA